MNKNIYKSNKKYKNPLLTTGGTMLGILLVIDYLYVFLNTLLDTRRSAVLISTSLMQIFSPFTLVSIMVIVLCCICTRNKRLFAFLQGTFFLPLLLYVFSCIRNYDILMSIIGRFPRAFARKDLVEMTNAAYTALLPLYLIIVTCFLGKALFSPHRYKGVGYLSIPLHIIMLLIMPGFWRIAWMFRTTRIVNKISAEPKRSPFFQTLLCILIPLYAVFWAYSTARRCDVVAVRKGLPSNTAVLCLILQIFLPFIPSLIIQDKINQIVSDDGTVQSAASPVPKAGMPADNVPEALMKYKQLLDYGIITQAEFDKKKAELLRL